MIFSHSKIENKTEKS